MFHRSRKKNTNTRIHMEPQKTTNIQAVPKSKNTAGGITISDFKLHYRARVTKSAWDWHKSR